MQKTRNWRMLARQRLGFATVGCAVFLILLSSTVYALYSVSPTGDWPKSWPAELEPLRAQAMTYVGPDVESHHYAIPFDSREAFEAAWQHLLKVKTPKAPIFLVRGPNFFLPEGKVSGVIVHSPNADDTERPGFPREPIKGVENLRMRWMNTTYIELVVDGKVVDLNQLQLPEEVTIIDERFKEQGKDKGKE
ncbi:MAG: hypothetical protein SFX18_16395 [Pirellulales bacterium]|nr:hypothetical protein [Pirellulales bacterium]